MPGSVGFPGSDEAFWNIAYACSAQRNKHHCQFDSAQCNQCNYYLRFYAQGVAEPAVKLLLLHAESQANDDKIRNRLHHFKYTLLMLLFIGLAIYGWNYQQRFINRTAHSQVYGVRPNDHADIVATLERVKAFLDRNTDVNGDGKINCIDASVLFYSFYPHRSKVQMWGNTNPDPSKDFNHLFIGVQSGGMWIGIEPQTYWLGRTEYGMPEVWGDRYNARYNENCTNIYRKYVR